MHEVVILAILQLDFVVPNFRSINISFNHNSMKQNSPPEANSFLASREIRFMEQKTPFLLQALP
jgi:hypothetical protein